MKRLKTLSIFSLFLVGGVCACDDAASKGKEKPNQVVAGWKSAKLTPIELEATKDGIAGGNCRAGKVAGLEVSLCEFSDAVAADSAKEEGVRQIAAHTGAALVRDRYLLVVADVDKVDVHGIKLNQVAKLFLNPPIPGAVKLSPPND